MRLAADEQRNESVALTRRAANRLRADARLFRAGLVVAVLLGLCLLLAGCGGGSSHPGVASLGRATTTTGPAAAQSGSKASPITGALAFIGCMRTHGEPNMPEPNIS